MKNLKNVMSVITLALVMLVSVNVSGQDIKESNDLKEFNSKLESEKLSGWPVNGCKSFSVTLTTGIGIEIQVDVVHCCVNGACAPQSMWNVLDAVFGKQQIKENPKGIKEITIKKSSKIKLGAYIVNIKTGTYKLNKQGQIEGLMYQGVFVKN